MQEEMEKNRKIGVKSEVSSRRMRENSVCFLQSICEIMHHFAECKIIVNEIVSLTASAHAAAPSRYQMAVQNFKSVSSSAEFQSSHFEATVDKFNTVTDGELTVIFRVKHDGKEGLLPYIPKQKRQIPFGLFSLQQL